MRTEKEMYGIILDYAYRNDDIRAVIMNGSRANPNRVADPFNDFDIVYLVKDVSKYKDKPFYRDFGELLVYERTDISKLFDENYPEFVRYLMQFSDGNRIDLTIADIKDFKQYCFDDGYAVVLLDKDDFLPEIPEFNEEKYFVSKPDEQMFYECRTEFWWVCPYVSKGLWRGQTLYAMKHMDCIRLMLLQMLEWYAGAKNDFRLSAGKCGDNLEKYIRPELWKNYLETYSSAQEDEIYNALIKACELFSYLSTETANMLSFSIDDKYDKKVPRFISYIKNLPKDAKSIDFDLMKQEY